jgi:hypothetical protein
MPEVVSGAIGVTSKIRHERSRGSIGSRIPRYQVCMELRLAEHGRRGSNGAAPATYPRISRALAESAYRQ